MNFLKELLGDEELFNKVVAKLGEKKLMLDDGTQIPKASHDIVSQKYNDMKSQFDVQKTEHEQQMTSVNSKLTEFESISSLTATQKEEITKLKSSNESIKAESDKKFAEFKKSALVDAALKDAGVIDPKDIHPHLNLDGISIDGENIVGLNDQLTPIKESKAYLFGTAKKIGADPNDGKSPQIRTEAQQAYDKAVKDSGGIGTPQAIAAKLALHNTQ